MVLTEIDGKFVENCRRKRIVCKTTRIFQSVDQELLEKFKTEVIQVKSEPGFRFAARANPNYTPVPNPKFNSTTAKYRSARDRPKV